MKKIKKILLLFGLTLCNSCNSSNQDSFVRGVDISSIISLQNSGVSFFDFNGKPCNIYQFLHSQGVTHVRVRVWVDPYNEKGQGYGGGNCNLNNAIAMAKEIKKAGLKMIVDFHYSDFWADPSRQLAPKSWQNKSISEKEKLLEDYTYQSLEKIKKTGVNIAIVQVGNEITTGLAGETSWDNIARLLQAGSRAIRQLDAKIQIALHFTDPQKEGYLDYFARTLEQYEIDYDIFGTSYYSYWHGTLNKLSSCLDEISQTYNKDVMVLETAFPYTLKDSDGFANNAGEDLSYAYEVSTDGQKEAIIDVMETMNKLSRGLGFCYWEPAWISVGSTNYNENSVLWEKWGSGCSNPAAHDYDPEHVGLYTCGSSWDNQALFDASGHPLPSLKAFQYELEK